MGTEGADESGQRKLADPKSSRSRDMKALYPARYADSEKSTFFDVSGSLLSVNYDILEFGQYDELSCSFHQVCLIFLRVKKHDFCFRKYMMQSQVTQIRLH